MTGQEPYLPGRFLSAAAKEHRHILDPFFPWFLQRVFRFVVLCFFFVFLLASSAPAAETVAAYPLLPPGGSSIRVFDNQGRFAGRILPAKRYWVTIDRIPRFLQNALVAVEDARFYAHGGVDVRGIARAFVKDVTKGRMAEGGSTITQQLIKNKHFHGEKTIERKVKEGILAMEYERTYTKKQILEMYFNEVYFGNGAWGLAQAARLYFDKNPEELTDAECVLLAGVPKAPVRYNPYGEPSQVRARRNVVLKRMVELSMISPKRAQKLKAAPVSGIRRSEAPYYLAHIRNKLIEQYGADIIERGGLDVIAAMDLPVQQLAERVLRDSVRRISPQLQGALLCMDPRTGDILAVVGGEDFTRSEYNRAFFARRQPGSAIKPLIYAAAVEKGLTASSLWNDAPKEYDRGNQTVWKPRNYDGELYGVLTLRQALAFSNNIVAVKLLETIGLPYFVDFAGTLGLSFQPPHDLSLALGTGEVTLSELVAAYAPLANGGMRPRVRTIVRVYERRRAAWTENPPAMAPVMSPAAAFITTQMLKDVLIYGTAKTLRGFSRERPAAGKTGTTDDYRDAWFIGYTPHVITGIWIGYDQPRPLGRGFTGGAVCAPVWGSFMRAVAAGKPADDFPQPENVVALSIDPDTGFLAAPDCPKRRDEYYLAGTEPTEYCPEHGGGSLPLPPASPPPAPTGQPADLFPEVP